jgi:hypothetical protein
VAAAPVVIVGYFRVKLRIQHIHHQRYPDLPLIKIHPHGIILVDPVADKIGPHYLILSLEDSYLSDQVVVVLEVMLVTLLVLLVYLMCPKEILISTDQEPEVFGHQLQAVAAVAPELLVAQVAILLMILVS